MSKEHRKNGSPGLSILEAIIAIAILGVLAVILGAVFKNGFGTAKHFKIKGEIIDTRVYLQNSFDCKKTVQDNKAECESSSWVSGKRADGTELFPKFPSVNQITPQTNIRARCVKEAGYYSINLEFRRFVNGSVQKDPLNSEISYDWQPINQAAPVTCKIAEGLGPCLFVGANVCPANYAVFGRMDGAGHQQNQNDPVDFQCCPVPTDFLSTDHVLENRFCGANRVSTGAVFTPPNIFQIRCTLINTAKYALTSPRRTTFSWLSSCPQASGWNFSQRRDWAELPIPLQINMHKRDNLATDPNYPGVLGTSDIRSGSFESICVGNANFDSNRFGSIIIGRGHHPGCPGGPTKHCGCTLSVGVNDAVSGAALNFFPTGCTYTSRNYSCSGDWVEMAGLKCTNTPTYWSDALSTSSGN